jgi:transcription elongation factor Elf1
VVKIECLACGKVVNIPTFIDTDNYDGQLVCKECKSILHVKLVKEKVQKYKIEKNNSEFNFTDLVLHMQNERNQQEPEKK